MLQALVGLLPWKVIAKACLGKYLSDPALKAQIVADLRASAAKTEGKYDDAAVNTFEMLWDLAIPTIVQKL